MLKRIPSSRLPIRKVNLGSMKKKFHITALNIELSNTGTISNKTASSDTVNRSMKATIL